MRSSVEPKSIPVRAVGPVMIVAALAAVVFAAAAAMAPVVSAAGAQAAAGDYCLECHVSPPPTLLNEPRPIEWARDVPCPALRKAHEETFQTDTLVKAIQNALRQFIVPGIDISAQEKRLAARRLTATQISEAEAVSLSAIQAQGKSARYQLNKVYAALNEARAQQQRLFVLAVVAAASAFVLAALALAWRNAAKGQGTWRRGRTSAAGPLLAALVVFAVFASPLFGVAPPDQVFTIEEAERQAAVDQAATVAGAATRLSAQSWTLGNIAAQWNGLDQVRAATTLSDAVRTSLDKSGGAAAYWGQAQRVRESAAAWRASTQDLAGDSIERLEAAASAAWELRAIAADWAGVDKTRAQSLLELALSQARGNPDGHQRDLQIRAIAVVGSGLDRTRAEAALNEVTDPMMRAWGLREIGETARAAEAARLIADPYNRAWSLREIARVAPSGASGAAFSAALDAALKVQEPQARAYALADLAAAWASADLPRGLETAGRIDPNHRLARVVALHGAARAGASREAFIKALSEAADLGDIYTTSKYTAAIAADYAALDANAAVEAAGAIGDAFFRDLAYRDIARVLARKDPGLARPVAAKVASPGLRAQALVAANSLPEAASLADKVEDTRVLRDVGVRLAPADPGQALALLDKLEYNADRSAVALAVALATRDSDKTGSAAAFARAVREARALRVTGEPFAAARALARLAVAYAPVSKAEAAEAFAQAVETAKRVNVKY